MSSIWYRPSKRGVHAQAIKRWARWENKIKIARTNNAVSLAWIPQQATTHINIGSLPNEVLIMIDEYLTLPESVCFGLTCRRNYVVHRTVNDYTIPLTAPSVKCIGFHLAHDLLSWFPDHMAYLPGANKFITKDTKAAILKKYEDWDRQRQPEVQALYQAPRFRESLVLAGRIGKVSGYFEKEYVSWGKTWAVEKIGGPVSCQPTSRIEEFEDGEDFEIDD